MNYNVKQILSQDTRENEILKTLVIDNMTIVKADNGIAQISLEITDAMLNVHKKIHGGVLFTISDSTAGACAVSLGKKVVTLNANINFIKATAHGKIVSKGKVFHKGRSTVVVEVETYDFATNNLLSTSSFTMFVIGQY